MGNIYPISYTFGTNVYKEIPPEKLEYFSNFFSEYFETSYSVIKNKYQYRTIPISLRRIAKYSEILSIKLIKYLKEYYGILDESLYFHSNDDLIIIDLTGCPRLFALLPLGGEIESLLKNDKSTQPRFVLIVDKLTDALQSLSILNSFVLNGKVLVIDKKKRFYFKNPKSFIMKSFSFENFYRTSLSKTKFKLIRKIGHFGRYDINGDNKEKLIACNQFFYDGLDCESELSDVLFDEIIKLEENKNVKITEIIYHSSESVWLKNSLLLLNSDLLALSSDYGMLYNESSLKEISNLTENTDKINLLFIVPLIHSGSTLKSNLLVLKKFYPNANIFILSVLVSDLSIYSEVNENEVVLNINEFETVKIIYLLSVSQNSFVSSLKKCPMCNELNLDINDSTYLNFNKLNSYEAWLMFDEAKYISEDNETVRLKPFPNKMKLKPNSLSLFENNAAYLAIKYYKHIEKMGLLQSSDLTIVFPDETSNEKELKRRGKQKIELEDTASGYFAETLMQLKKLEYFGIPREIIEKLKNYNNTGEPFSLEDIKKQYKDFYNRLNFISDDIIVMDEFGFSGGTFDEICKILSIVDKKPKAFFPVFNFYPKRFNTDKYAEMNILSLYEFNLKV